MSMISEEWAQKIEARREWFLEDESYRVLEEKKPGALKKIKDMFGSSQSLKSLEID